jgi:hypothetical protein
VKFIQAKVSDLDYMRFKMAAVQGGMTLRELIVKALDQYIKTHNLLTVQPQEEDHGRGNH